MHDEWEIDYCADCGIITGVRVISDDVPCHGGEYCDECGLPMNRNAVNADMEYQIGHKFQGDVQ